MPQTLHQLPLHFGIAAGKVQEYLPLGRNGNGISCPVEELEAQVLFQLIQLLGQCRLGDEQVLGGQSDIFAFLHFQNIVENIGVHVKPPA